jgi:hypothetical protein
MKKTKLNVWSDFETLPEMQGVGHEGVARIFNAIALFNIDAKLASKATELIY